jgi:hypothetical protein
MERKKMRYDAMVYTCGNDGTALYTISKDLPLTYESQQPSREEYLFNLY